jgi:hypothetical protein
LPASYVSLQSALDYLSPTWRTASPASRPNVRIAGRRRWAASSSTTSSPPGCTAIAGSKVSQYAFVATPEKALLDLAYLHPRADDPAFLQELRLQNLERLDLAQLRALADRSAKPKLRRFAERVAALAQAGDGGIRNAVKDYLRELLRSALTPTHGRNLLREYLQARILAELQRAGAMLSLAFQGGTALRFLYGLPRYSEDLGFTLERSTHPFDFRDALRAIRAAFEQEGYAVTIKLREQSAVKSAFVGFPGLPFELALSPHRDEALRVKIEIDTNPPAGAGLTTTMVRRHVLLQLHHHDRASLLAGKLHAVLQRPYVKGRDFFDLLWYLSDPGWPSPNLTLLNHALVQTGWRGPTLTDENWCAVLHERLQNVSWLGVVDDVRPFLEPSVSADLLTRENLLRALEGRGGRHE